MKRGEIWWARMALPAGRRPVVLISRNDAYLVRERITIAEVTTRMRGLVTEVSLRPSDGVPRACVINADNIVTIAKGQLETKIASLSAEKVAELDRALAFSIGLER